MELKFKFYSQPLHCLIRFNRTLNGIEIRHLLRRKRKGRGSFNRTLNGIEISYGAASLSVALRFNRTLNGIEMTFGEQDSGLYDSFNRTLNGIEMCLPPEGHHSNPMVLIVP